jgi:hypothetical protein
MLKDAAVTLSIIHTAKYLTYCLHILNAFYLSLSTAMEFTAYIYDGQEQPRYVSRSNLTASAASGPYRPLHFSISFIGTFSHGHYWCSNYRREVVKNYIYNMTSDFIGTRLTHSANLFPGFAILTRNQILDDLKFPDIFPPENHDSAMWIINRGTETDDINSITTQSLQ